MAKVTLSFSGWSPDQSDVGVQITPYQPAVTVPCADVLNVYYQDSSFRSLPSPASIGPTLGIPITNAVTWYDDSTGKEEIFAATANGIYALVDGTWGQIPVQTNSGINAQGQILTISQGTPTYTVINYSFSVSPSSQTQTGTSTSFTFSAETVTSTPTPSAYSWYFSGGVGTGTFSILSGQGTASAVVQVTGCTPAAASSITLRCQLTIGGTNYYTAGVALQYTATQLFSGTLAAGQKNVGSLSFFGYDPGQAIGSLIPSTDAFSRTVGALYVFIPSVGNPSLNLNISGFASDPGASYFTTLTLDSTAFPSASASYSYSAGTAGWVWENPSTGFIPGDSYAITYS